MKRRQPFLANVHQFRIARAKEVFKNPNTFLNLYYGLSSARCEIHTISGIRLSIRGRDHHGVCDVDIVDEILIRDIYRVQNLVKTGDTILDIGAQIGVFALTAATLSRDKTVIAIEPEMGNFDMLKQNVALNPHLSVIPYRLALAAVAGYSVLGFSPLNVGAHSLYLSGGRHGQVVKTATLSQLLALLPSQRPNVIKMDCEGCERVLDTSAHDLTKVDRIMIEVHQYPNNEMWQWSVHMATILSAAGFQVEELGKLVSKDGVCNLLQGKRLTT